MDLDAFSAVRTPRWERLSQLTKRRRRTGAEIDEMTRLYRATAADLSAVRSAAPEPAMLTRLSMLLAASRVWLTGGHGVRGGEIREFFATGMPAALYLVRWWAVGYGLLVVGLGVLSGVHASLHPEVLELVATPQQQDYIAREAFESYYTEYDSTSFTALVWTNNAWLALEMFVTGVTGVLPAILAYNTALQLGVNAAILQDHGMLGLFFQLILPHGLLELSAVFLAAGAGVHMGWRLLVPGVDRNRAEAFAQAFRTLLAAMLGVVIALFVSGIIEGFVTPSDLPWGFKVAVGVIAATGFWAYIFVAGRAAVRGGATGDVDTQFRAESAAVAA